MMLPANPVHSKLLKVLGKHIASDLLGDWVCHWVEFTVEPVLIERPSWEHS